MAVSRIFVIAEAGVNHDGSLMKARELVDAAKYAKANAVKFQMFSSQKLWGDDRIKHLELCESEILDLAAHCADAQIEFMCTPFGEEEVLFLNSLVTRHKIASGCIGRRAILDAVAHTGKPAILSTGMSTYDDIRNALKSLGDKRTTLLHCTSAYPCPLKEVNLRAMQAMGHFGCPVGYSDHTRGMMASLSAAAMGASVIEKHLTLDRRQPGPDHLASMEPRDFKRMIEKIREVETLLGERSKSVQPSEAACHKAWRG